MGPLRYLSCLQVTNVQELGFHVRTREDMLDGMELMAGDDFVEPLYTARLKKHYEKEEQQWRDTISRMRQDEQRRLTQHSRSGDSLPPAVCPSSVTNSRGRHGRTLRS
jgi:hypothetical protein